LIAFELVSYHFTADTQRQQAVARWLGEGGGSGGRWELGYGAMPSPSSILDCWKIVTKM